MELDMQNQESKKKNQEKNKEKEKEKKEKKKKKGKEKKTRIEVRQLLDVRTKWAETAKSEGILVGRLVWVRTGVRVYD